MASCERCGKTNEATANFCAQCGARIAQGTQSPVETGTPTTTARTDWDWRYFAALWICSFAYYAAAMRDQVAGHPAAYAAGEITGASAAAPVLGLVFAGAVKLASRDAGFWRTAIATAVIVIVCQVVNGLFYHVR